MPYLKLIDATTRRITEILETPARLGRSPDCTVLLEGGAVGVVSGIHAELRYEAGEWRLTDLASRNGTFVNGHRLGGPTPLRVGDVMSFGETGPRLIVAALSGGLPPTIPEHPGVPEPARRGAPVEPRAYGITLLDAGTGHLYEARGVRIRIGRGRECEVRLAGASEGIVSRVHAELTVGSSGALTIQDAGSTNGTFVNDDRVSEPVPVRLGDRITLGRGGPVLIVEGLGTSPRMPVARSPVGNLLHRAKRSSTGFVRAVAAEVGKDSRRKLRWLAVVVIVLVALLSAAVYGVYWLLSTQVELTENARRSAEDSARAETERLRRELAAARAGAAPATLVESLRAQVESAQVRTAELRAALDRAQAALTAQLASGEARRLVAQGEVDRLREELAAAERRAPPAAMLDSLRRAVATAEQQAQNLDAKMRAIRGTDFAAIAQQNQGAVGLITVSFGRERFNATGFVITPDGYMLTNWHVVADSQRPRPDTMWITMADQSLARYADVIATSQERDIALVKIRDYQGVYISTVDWSGTRARQGEPAALIGFPAGSAFAHLRSSVVRTSMSAGIISRATEDVIQFDGMTIGGSSGSPLFNADGEVIAIHRAGLPQAPGFALSVPTKHAVGVMPPALRQRLGIP